MTELVGGDKPVSKRVMNTEPEDTVPGELFRRSNRVALMNEGLPS
jgi:hypothetical protein